MQDIQPNFLVIGAQKSGTTWLWRNLRRHPKIFMPTKKELEFFSYNKSPDTDTWCEYLEHFEEGKSSPWRGECTPSYFISSDRSCEWSATLEGFNKNIPATVNELLGENIKFFVLLRQPTERAISAFYHHFKFGRVTPENTIFELGRMGAIIEAGFYARHLKAWLDYFPRDNFLVTSYHRIATEPAKLLDEALSFLNLEAGSLEPMAEKFNAGVELVLDQDRIAPESNSETGPYITLEEISKLNTIYSDDMRELESMLGWSLPQFPQLPLPANPES